MPNQNVDDLLDRLFYDQEELRLAHREYYLSRPQEYLELADRAITETTAGPLLGIALGAVFSGIAGASWLAIGLGIVSGLVQWWLAPQPPRERQPDAQFTPEYGSESLGGFARNGATKPAIFCSVALDSTGGVVTGGDLLHSRIVTVDGRQQTYARYSLGHGEIGKVDLALTTVNEQPINSNYVLTWQPGKVDQKALPDYTFYSQNVPATVENGCGAGLISKSINAGSDRIGVSNVANFASTYDGLFGLKITRWYRLNVTPERFFTVASVDLAGGTITTNQNISQYLQIGQTVQFSTPAGGIAGTITALPIATSSVFNVPAEEFEAYSGGNSYLAITDASASQSVIRTPFKAIQKTKIVQNGVAYYSITSDTQLPPGNAQIYSYDVIRYQTTKIVDRIDLNFRAQVWGRNKSGELIDFAQIYSLWIKEIDTPTYLKIATFYIRSSNPGTLYRSIELRGLQLGSYQVEIRPEVTNSTDNFGSAPVLNLKAEGSFYNAIGTNFTVTLNSQAAPSNDSVSFLSGLANQSKDRAPDNSAQRGATLSLMHVNEIQTKQINGQSVNCSYSGLATVEVFHKATAVSGGSLNFAFFVSEGIKVNRLVATGESSDLSQGASFKPMFALMDVKSATFIRNLSKRKSSPIVSASNKEVVSLIDLNWEPGDHALLYYIGSTCWWPEIRAEIYSSPKFGIADQVLADFYLDYPSHLASTKWVSGENEHGTKFAWHGFLSQTANAAEINNDNCKKVLLAPASKDGRAGYFEQKTPPIKALYNPANSKNERVEYPPTIRTSFNTVVVTYRERESLTGSLKFSPRTVTAQTYAARLGNQSIRTTAINLSECTSRDQAIKTAQLMLNVSRYGGKIATSFDGASIESLSLEVGCLIDYRSPEITYAEEYGGVVVEVNEDEGVFRLDNDLIVARGVAIGGGLIDAGADFVAAGVKYYDVVRIAGKNGYGRVEEVYPQRLVVSGIIVVDKDQYEILSMGWAGGMVAAGLDAEGRIKVQQLITSVDPNAIQWHRLDARQPIVGDLLAFGALGESKRLMQCLSITPTISEDEITVGVIATNWSDQFFNYRDIVISDRRGVFNAP